MAKTPVTFKGWDYKTSMLAVLGISTYAYLAYGLERTQFGLLLGLYAVSFVVYLGLYGLKKGNFTTLLFVGISFRLIFLLALPNLSQDYYRFIWDGHLTAHFINPYLEVPNTLITQEHLPYPKHGSYMRAWGT